MLYEVITATVNAQPILVLTGKGKKTRRESLPAGTLVYADLDEAVKSLVQ